MHIAASVPFASGLGAPPTPLKNTAVLIASTLIVSLGGLLFCVGTAVVAGTAHSLRRVFTLAPTTLGITVSSVFWGAVIGALLAGYARERFDRRDSLWALTILYLLSAVGYALVWNWTAQLAARIIGGLGIGGSSVVCPIYITETSPARQRAGWWECFRST
jgi:SP family arabinose:H+ symporter-like MFS transporter